MTAKARLFSIATLATRLRSAEGGMRGRTAREAQLRRLIRHAYHQVPFYRDLFDHHGLCPSAIQGLPDLAELPPVSKRELQLAGVDRRLAAPFRGKRLFTRSTSGSTGEPMVVCCTWFEESVLSCLRAMVWRRIGVRATDRLVRVRIPIPSRRQPGWLSFLQGLGVHRQAQVDCLLPPEEILRRVRHLAPTVLSGFPGILSAVAQENGGLRLPSLRFVIVGGETLDLLRRRHIERGFQVPVWDTYGSHEFNQIAAQCERGRLHVCEDTVILEILRDGTPAEPGESGEAVVTALHSFAMPFIRYRLGDFVTRGPDDCECGRAGLTLESVEGRIAELLVLRDGRKLHPFSLIRELSHDFDLVRRYRLIQEAEGTVRLEIVPAVSFPTVRLEAMRKRMLDAADGGLTLDLALVEEIPAGSRGKLQVFLNRLQREDGPELAPGH
jgi:phenylacetate-CoA ligase